MRKVRNSKLKFQIELAHILRDMVEIEDQMETDEFADHIWVFSVAQAVPKVNDGI